MKTPPDFSSQAENKLPPYAHLPRRFHPAQITGVITATELMIQLTDPIFFELCVPRGTVSIERV